MYPEPLGRSESNHSAEPITEIMNICDRLGLNKPIADQCSHNAIQRNIVDKDLVPVFDKYGYGTTTHSSLAAGLLTGKYNDGNFPPGSRFDADPLTKASAFMYYGPDKDRMT